MQRPRLARSGPSTLATAQPGALPGPSATLVSAAPASATERVARAATIALGVIWLIDGALQYQSYMFHETFITGVVMPNTVGQPGVVAEPITWIAHQIEPHVALFNGFAATLQVLIGLGLLYRRTVKPALLVSIFWGLGVWFMGEGFGALLTGNASPLTGAPGAVLLYIFIALICWPTAGEREAAGGEPKLGLLGERRAQLLFAAVWLLFAALWLFPANDGRDSVSEAVSAVPSGAGWLTSILNEAARAAAGAGTAIAVVMAVVSAAIALAVWREWHIKAFLALAMVVGVIFWVVGQGFGGLMTGQATDVNSGPLLVLFAAILFALRHEPPLLRRRARAAT